MSPERWQQIKEVLDEALTVVPSARADFLSKTCVGDEDLRREVESFLAFDGAPSDLLENNSFADAIQEVFNEPSVVFLNREIGGKYRIVGELGAGGMGSVFLAERIDGEFEQKVAVKFLRQGFLSPSARQRFRRERQILARLQHRYIAALIDGGATDDGTPYLVMEYVEGTPITRFVRENNLSVVETIDLFRSVCRAVSFAHQNLIVHRDLKPENILITADGTPKLLDFGIAKLLSETEIKATVTHQQALTPEYAAPEQILGQTITTATDVYSLGVILYEILTGAHPFRRANMSPQQIWQSITQTEPARPSSISSKFQVPSSKSETRNPKSQIPNPKSLKGDLDNIILKALKKEPARRYGSVEQFSRDLQFYLKGFPVSARPDTLVYRAGKFLSRNPLACAAVLIALVSLVSGIFVASHKAREAQIEREKAERRFNDVRQLANSFMFEINEQIEKSPVKARELLVQRAVEYLDKLSAEETGDAELQSELAAAYEKIGDVQSELFKPTLGKTSAALRSHQKALEIRERLFIADPTNVERGLETAMSRMRIGDIFMMSGRIAEARDIYSEAIRLNEQMLVREPANQKVRRHLSRVFSRRGQSVLRSGSLAEARQNYEKSLENYQKLFDESPNDSQLEHSIAIVNSYIGYVELERGDFAEALNHFQTSLEIEKRVFETDKTNALYRGGLINGHLWVGVALRDAGQIDAGIAEIRTALEMQKTVFEADKSNFGERNWLADCYLELGIAEMKANDSNAARENFQTAIEHYRAVWEHDRENLAARRQIAFAQKHVAETFLQNEKPDKSLNLFRQTLEEYKKLVEADPHNSEWRHDLAFCYLKIGESLMKTGARFEAAQNFKTAAAIYETLSAASPENLKIQRESEAVKKHLAEFD
jgi:eukaryotic-like serine/threonine-protein kinase